MKGIIQTSYKQSRHDDDLNQPLSVQPWGSDADKRRYYLIEGLDDTNFRIYRESSHLTKNRTWFSVAGSIDELKALAEKLNTQDGGQKARTLSAKMMAAIPRFEATEEVCFGDRLGTVHGLIERNRSESAESTELFESSSSSVPTLDSLCMKDVLAARE